MWLPISSILLLCLPTTIAGFVHPGGLSTDQDFARIAAKLDASESPWVEGYDNLVKSRYARVPYVNGATDSICRGVTCAVNSGDVFTRDTAAAYQLALRWKISGNETYGIAATEIINAWSSTLKNITGNNDHWLLAGLQGYEMANAAEIIRDFDGFSSTNLTSIIDMLTNVFYTQNAYFLDTHGGGNPDYPWANWDLCNMASIIAIGILADDQAMFDKAVNYFYSGIGEGRIDHLVWKIYEDGLGQVQESGRDQGHSTLDIALVGAFAQMAYNQGVDLFAYENNRILAGSEYVAKYNLGLDVPFTHYNNSGFSNSVISPIGRGTIRPIWDLIYYHYTAVKGVAAPYTYQMAQLVRSMTNDADSGGGSYGPNSGGFDQLGFTTLLYAQDPAQS